MRHRPQSVPVPTSCSISCNMKLASVNLIFIQGQLTPVQYISLHTSKFVHAVFLISHSWCWMGDNRGDVCSKKKAIKLLWSQPQSIYFLFPVVVPRTILWKGMFIHCKGSKLVFVIFNAFPMVLFKPTSFTGVLLIIRGIVYINALWKVWSTIIGVIICSPVPCHLVTILMSLLTTHHCLFIILEVECSQL